MLFFSIAPSLVFFCQLGCGEKYAVLVPQCFYTINNKVLEHRFYRLKAKNCSLVVRLFLEQMVSVVLVNVNHSQHRGCGSTIAAFLPGLILFLLPNQPVQS